MCALQLTEMMAATPVSDADKGAKAALFMRIVEVLPAAIAAQQEAGGSLAMVTDLLAAVRRLVAGPHELHHALFRCGSNRYRSLMHKAPLCTSGNEMWPLWSSQANACATQGRAELRLGAHQRCREARTSMFSAGEHRVGAQPDWAKPAHFV